MDALTLNLKQVFEPDRRYLVPLFQRPYVWGPKEQWEPLWEDVRAVAEWVASGKEPRPHFLGAVVLDHVKQPLTRVEARLVIDGQQRLTTLQLLLEAASDICKARSFGKYHRAFLKLTRNEDPLSDDPDDVYKVWPTNMDRDAFRTVMQAHSPESLLKEVGSDSSELEKPVARAYIFFTRSIDAWLKEEPGDAEARIGHLHSALREWIRLVVIELGEKDDPQLIFETLNARSTPLLPADLVKNYLFHAAQRSGAKVETLHAKYWKAIDEESSYWREPISAGRLKRSRIDLFLQHYLTMRTREEVQVAHLYAAFRAYLVKSTESAEEQLASLARYARLFRRFDELDPKSRLGAFLARLEDLEVTTVHPLLLHLFGMDVDPAAMDAIVTDIESFLVRRMVCRLTTKNYNRLFLDALSEVGLPGAPPAATLRKFLLAGKGESVRWPSEHEFRQAWFEMPVYHTIAKRRVRLVLEVLEQALRGPKTEAALLPKKLTIEHILPQNWTEHWVMAPGSSATPDIRNRVLHTFGNLTLLTNSLNPAVSNGPWGQKRTAIKDHSILMLNKPLSESEAWDEQTIRSRGEALLKHATNVWPRPQTENDGAEVTQSYADLGRSLMGETADVVDPAGEGAVVCPIEGCGYEYESWPMGWDGHVKSVKKHPRWHPTVLDADERALLFRKEYKEFIAANGGVASDRPWWEAHVNPSSFGVVDACVKLLADAGRDVRMTYNRGHIAVGSPVRNFAWFFPRKTQSYCDVEVRFPENEVAGRVEELVAGTLTARRSKPHLALLKLNPTDLLRHGSLLQSTLKDAMDRAK